MSASKRTALVGVLFIWSVLPCAFAQAPQYGFGILSGYTYTGQHESVNLASGNLTLQIPLLKLPGRNGYDYNLVLTYNSQIWAGGVAINPQGSQFYFWQALGFLGQTSLSNGWSESGGGQLFSDQVLVEVISGVNVYCSENYRIKWGDGHVDSYPGLVTNCMGASWPEVHTAGVGYAGASSFCLTSRSVLTVPDTGTPTLYREDGSKVFFGGSFNLAASSEDSNGNKINYASSGIGITKDTLGRSVTSSSGSPANSSFNYTYTDSNGNAQIIQMIYQNVPINPVFPAWQNAQQPGQGTWSMLSSVIAANGDRWDFTYDSFGELSKVTYPTGGYTSYGYGFYGTALGSCTGPGATFGCTVSYPSRQLTSIQVCRDTNTRANGGSCSSGLLDPPTTITPSTTSSGGTNQTSTVVDPLGNKTAYTFGASGLETQRQIYQGSSTLLRTVATTQSCDGPTKQTITLNDGSNLVSETDWTRGTPIHPYSFSQSANLTQKVEYDWGAAPHGPKLRTINYTWLATNSINGVDYTSVPILIINRKLSETVLDGSGNTAAQTTYEYDSYGSGITASGAIQHDSSFSTTYKTRGNVDKLSRWLNTTNTWLSTINTYDDAGNILTIKDPNNNVTSFSYADNFANGAPTGSTAAYVTQTTLPTTGTVTHVSHKQYFFNTGLVAASCGENFTASCNNAAVIPQPDYATFTYDAIGRPLVSTVGDGGQTTITYSDDQPSPPAQFNVTTSQKIAVGQNKTSIALMDGIGEVTQTQLTSDPDGTDYVDTAYDSLGRQSTVSNPHRSSSLPSDGISTYNYDALGRVTSVLEQDGSTLATSYFGNTVTVTDETGKKRKSVSDGAGRLTQVFEDPAGLNYETDYAYDALNNLLSVTQKGSAPGNSALWRTRSFTYDSLSRLVCAANPEVHIVACPSSPSGPFPAGTITYTYDSDSNVLTKVAPSPNQPSSGTASVTTTYSYDALNRLTGKSYMDSYASNTATSAVQYGYDGAALTGCHTTPPPLTDSHPIGRSTAMCDGSGATSWNHDTVGRSLQEVRVIGTAAGKQDTDAYNLDGSVASITTLTYTIAYKYNNAGRMISAKNTADPFNFVTAATYAPFGALATATLGATPITISNQYNSRLQPAVLSADTAAATIMSLSYDFHSSTHANNGNVFQIVNNRDNNRTQNFIYDPLNRIQQAYTSGPSWGETFSPTPTAPGVAPTTSGIDAWGNLNNRSGVTGKTNYEPLSCTVNTNNQLTACSFNYDAAGNMTSNGSASYIYDAENRLIATAGMSYIYDGDGARVKKCTQGTTPGTCATGATGTLYWIRAGSDDPLVETDLAENRLEDYIFFNGQRIARREPGPPAVFHFYFSDHLGTHSLITDANGTMPPQSESDYYPYGGEIPISGSDSNRYKFNGKERDPESGLDNFGARYDSSALGRFMTPDWGGGPVPYASMGSPQTLNLYSYVMNNPVSKTDPTGHVCEGGDCGDSHGEGTSLAQEFSESVSRAVWGPSIGELMQNAAAASLAAQGELLDSLFESEAEQTTASNPSVQVNREAQNPFNPTVTYDKSLSAKDLAADQSKVGAAIGVINANWSKLSDQEKATVGNIKSIDVSGSAQRSYVQESTGKLTLTQDYVSKSSKGWLASAIGHDGEHVALFNSGGIGASRGLPAEVKAMQFQLQVGTKFGLSATETKYLQGLIQNPSQLQQYINTPP